MLDDFYLSDILVQYLVKTFDLLPGGGRGFAERTAACFSKLTIKIVFFICQVMLSKFGFRTGLVKPGKFSRPGKSWSFYLGHGNSWEMKTAVQK